MNQVEPWFLILQRQRLLGANFADKHHMVERLMAVVAAWNERARPFRWSIKFVAKAINTCEHSVGKAA
jgi:hypothetical protein